MFIQGTSFCIQVILVDKAGKEDCPIESERTYSMFLASIPLDNFPKLHQNKNKINLLPLSSGGHTIKPFTLGTTINVHHPDSDCLLFQATAPSNRPPEPTSSLSQTASLWFFTANCCLRLNLFAFSAAPSAHLPMSHRCGLEEGSRECIRLEREMESNQLLREAWIQTAAKRFDCITCQ